MNHILEATGFPDSGLHGVGDAVAAPRPRRRLPWERAIRCLLLTAILALVGYLAWRPALLRFSQLMFMVSPSHGDSLAWKPDIEEPPLRLSPRRETPAPAEWRLATGMYGGWRAERSGLGARSQWRGPSQIPAYWQRLSGNPWNWQDDAPMAKPGRVAGESPTQKPATTFRAKATDAWGTALSDIPARRQAETVLPSEQLADRDEAATGGGSADAPAARPAQSIPSLAPLPSLAAAAKSAEPERAADDSATAMAELPPLHIPELPSQKDKSGLMELPALAVDSFVNEPKAPTVPAVQPVEPAARPETTIQPETVALPETTALPEMIVPPVEAVVPPVESAGTLRPSIAPVESTAAAATSLWQQVTPTVEAPQPEAPVENAATQVDWTQFVVPTPVPEVKSQVIDALEQASHGEILVSTPVFQTSQPEATASTGVASAESTSPVNAPESADWKNQEITGPIAGAYLTIYPKLKFIGLCVPGQGYIRKYNQVAVPHDTAGEKVVGADGRTPYGKYYIAARSREPEGPRLVLSWPSPDDARRLGLDPAQTALIETAWLNQSLPPQDTLAGGGVALTGLRDRLESTDGGFALEEPHMEEIYTALPHGAWVFIQE